MTPDEERWAEALAVQKMHGGRAALFVAEQLGASIVAGDTAGIERWKQIARRLNQLIFPDPPRQ